MAIDAPTDENERPTKFELPSSAYRSGLETVCICLSILSLIARHRCFWVSIEIAEVCLILRCYECLYQAQVVLVYWYDCDAISPAHPYWCSLAFIHGSNEHEYTDSIYVGQTSISSDSCCSAWYCISNEQDLLFTLVCYCSKAWFCCHCNTIVM